MGADNIPIGGYIYPSLTTINYPIDEIAENATNLILDRIKNKESNDLKTITLSYRLVKRDSTSTAK